MDEQQLFSYINNQTIMNSTILSMLKGVYPYSRMSNAEYTDVFNEAWRAQAESHVEAVKKAAEEIDNLDNMWTNEQEGE